MDGFGARHFRDTSETLPRHFGDTSETLPRHFLGVKLKESQPVLNMS